jgi:hypothetical protein
MALGALHFLSRKSGALDISLVFCFADGLVVA